MVVGPVPIVLGLARFRVNHMPTTGTPLSHCNSVLYSELNPERGVVIGVKR